MRTAVRDYIWAVHTTYLDHVQQWPPAERAALPLLAADELTVVAAAATRLHLIATTDALPEPVGPEVRFTDEHRGTRWSVRFFDPSILPELGILGDDQPSAVRQVIGLADTVYHLTVSVGGGLTEHHAQHSGVALANSHASQLRAVEKLRHALYTQQQSVDELASCTRLGLHRAAALLATELTAGRFRPSPDATAGSCLDAVVTDVTERTQ